MEEVVGDPARERLAKLAAELRAFVPDGDYYALTLRANRRDQVEWSRQAHFVGLSSRRDRWEIRATSLVDP